MRIAVAALCVLALTGSAEAIDSTSHFVICAQYDAIPERYQQSPEVDWNVVLMPRERLMPYCLPPAGATSNACTFPVAAGSWIVLVADDLPPESEACAVQYELSHMPPNFWGDPQMEQPETMSWLTMMRQYWLRYERTR